MVIDESGGLTSVKRHDYLPFGEEIATNVGIRTPGQGYSAGDGVRQQFTSKERDIETGLDYFVARYYSSGQGRFTSPDEFTGGPDELYAFVDDVSANPMLYADPARPQSLNKYQYAYNNPMRWIDPDGHDAEETAEQDPKPSEQPDCHCPPLIPIPTRNPVQWFFDEIVGDRRRREMLEELRKENEEYERKVREGMEMLNKPIPIPPMVKPAPKPEQPQPVTPSVSNSPQMSRKGRGGKQRQRDSGLAKEKDADISRKARDKSLPTRERRRYQKEEKARGLRNKEKRKGD